MIFILTNLDFTERGEMWPPSDMDERTRLQEHVKNRKLYEELHEQIFPKYLKYLSDDKQDDKIQKIIIGIAETATTNYMDLLLGEAPIITAPKTYPIPDEELFIDVSRYGLGLLEVTQTGITIVNPENAYIVVNPSNIRDVLAFVVFHEFEISDGEKSTKYVKLTIHEPGTIRHVVYNIHNGKLEYANLLDFPEFEDLIIDDEGYQQTGVEDFLMLKVDNALSSERYYGRSDYTPSVHTLIEALEMAFARRAEVLAKFSRPIPMVPENAMQFDHSKGRWIFKTDNAIILKEGQPSAAYLTWQANLADVEVEIKDLFDQLLVKLKLSRVLLAGDNTGSADSGTSLRIRLIPTLSKVRKFASAYKEVVPKAFSLMSYLDAENEINNEDEMDDQKEEVAPFDPDDVIIVLQDGIPSVPLEDAQLRLLNAQALSQLKIAGVLDNKTAMRAAILMNIVTEDIFLPLSNSVIEDQISMKENEVLAEEGI